MTDTEGSGSELERLAPCPFCGKVEEDEDGPLLNYGLRAHRGEVRFVVCCIVQTDDFDTDAEAIAAWNRRSAPTVSAQGVEERERIYRFSISGPYPEPGGPWTWEISWTHNGEGWSEEYETLAEALERIAEVAAPPREQAGNNG